MHVVRTRNVHQALPEVMHLLKTFGKPQDSRNGPVLRILEPVSIVYEKPCERVMLWPQRDANPFFHVLESLWMLAGRNDVAFPASIVQNMASFSDDGVHFHGAYGYRWRQWFKVPDGPDQLTAIAEALRENPNCRRQVLQMWDASYDLGVPTKDAPCNTHAYFSIDDTNCLNMMVCNRSNDAVWGALGANAVHFSVLQEYMAAMIGCGMGKYWQTTNNLHLYLDLHADLMEEMAAKAFPSKQYESSDLYHTGRMLVTPLVRRTVAQFDADTRMLLEEGCPPLGTQDWFTRKIASPMLGAIRAYKYGDGNKRERLLRAQEVVAAEMPDNYDWTIAATEWLARREG